MDTPNLGNVLREESQRQSEPENDVRDAHEERAVDSIENDISESVNAEGINAEDLSDVDVESVDDETAGEAADDTADDTADDIADDTVEEAEEEPPAEPTPDEIIAQLREDLAASEARVGEQMDKLQRTAAEFQNSKRRQEKQLGEQIQRASLHSVEQILPVLDDLELGFNNIPADIPEEINAWLDGFRKIQGKLFRILENQEVTAIESEGQFDPSRHDAISSEEHEEIESGHIIETLRTGYEHKGRILRPAMVRVAA